MNYLITIPIYHPRSEEIGNGLIENVTAKYCLPDYIIMDQDSAFTSSLMNYLFKKLNIKIKTVAAYNHQSSQAEHGIKSLHDIKQTFDRFRSDVAKIVAFANLDI